MLPIGVPFGGVPCSVGRSVGSSSFVLLTPRLLKCTPFGGRCSLSCCTFGGEYQFVTLPRLCKTHFRVNSTVTVESQQIAEKLRRSFGGWRSFMYFCNARGGINLQRPSLVPTKLFFSLVFLLEDFIPNRSLFTISPIYQSTSIRWASPSGAFLAALGDP